MLITLTQQERGRLERLNKDTETIEGLKKLFLNSFIKVTKENSTEILATERKAIELLQDAFKELARIRTDSVERVENENLV